MARHRGVIREVEAAEEGPGIGAFFDFDGTVIYGYSAIALIREQVRRGDLSPREFVELAALVPRASHLSPATDVRDREHRAPCPNDDQRHGDHDRGRQNARPQVD